MELDDKCILLTGSHGFLGRHVVQELKKHGLSTLEAPVHYPGKIITVRSADFNLTQDKNVERLYRAVKPHIVIHLAAKVGGIGINRQKPGTFYYDNLMMGTLTMHHAAKMGVMKYVNIGTICSYPKYTPIPFKEEELWNGYPEETNAPYGIAKKAILTQSIAYRQEFGFNGIYLLPVNLYGPGDNFNPNSSHVIPAIIKKCLEAKKTNAESIECWGTGQATREFLHASDAARAIVLATKHYNKPEPVNIGSGHEITILALTELIMKLCDCKATIKLNPSLPDGQPRRCLDTTKAEEEFGFKSTTSLIDGLKETIEWYKKEIEC